MVFVQFGAGKCEEYLVYEYIADTPAYRAVLVSPSLRLGDLNDQERGVFLKGDGMLRGISFWVTAAKYSIMLLIVMLLCVAFIKRRFK
ncbi:hypothetical protein D8779_12755 [Pseudomonas leptonychotis]|uniref:Uncharacterized protein n=2 Tax=Pseudomonas leptonychotis TaxID=2448482 RepID=A0A4T1ZW13_9PSED|nr:hypothetical protein D8779_12755 [Pseudomonas leptonychotis]